ncbi:MAG: hypothetical protein V1910_00905 [bacterium]
MNKKNILFLFISIIFSFLFYNFTQAIPAPSSEGITVATVYLHNAKIISNDERNYKISFDISNKVGAQPQIKYAVRLTASSSNKSILDEKVYDEILSMKENSTFNKIIDYTIPDALPIGTYRLWIESKNGSGLPLGIAFVGEIKITKNIPNTVEIINDSCFFITGTEKIPLSRGIVLDSQSPFIMKCKIRSSFSKNIILTPIFITRDRTAFGDIVANNTNDKNKENITIKKGENEITFTLPKVEKPQSYNLNLSLISTDEKTISNTVTFNYVLSGQSGIIQNVVFNKTFYKKGEKAKLQIFSTTQADVKTSTITALILNNDGIPCSATSSKEVSHFSVLSLSIPIIKECLNPKANIILSSADGSILDVKNFQVSTIISTSTPTIMTMVMEKIIPIIIIVIILASFFVFLILKKRSQIK